MLMYDSSVYGHYLRKNDRKQLGLPIFPISAKKVGVANGGACNGKYVTKMPLPQLSSRAAGADAFEELPTSLLSVVKTANDSNMSILTK